jgi:signal recognition particle receptor subunit beta
VEQAVKIAVVGHFGVGKTTFVGAISEITPLRTEEPITQASAGIDDLHGLPGKDTTTVAMDFGRVTLGGRIALYLFGAPGQPRFKEMWDTVLHGALGVLVLADPRSLATSFPVIDLVESRGLPYAVALNAFDGAPDHPLTAVRSALDLAPSTLLVACDARRRDSVRDALAAFVEHLLTQHHTKIAETL